MMGFLVFCYVNLPNAPFGQIVKTLEYKKKKKKERKKERIPLLIHIIGLENSDVLVQRTIYENIVLKMNFQYFKTLYFTFVCRFRCPREKIFVCKVINVIKICIL